MTSDEQQATIFVENQSYNLDITHPNFKEVVELAELGELTQEQYDTFLKLADVPKAVEEYCHQEPDGINIQIKDGVVLWHGRPIHNNMTERLLALMRDGAPTKFFIRFLNNLMQNPGWLSDGWERDSVESVYDFLKHNNMPLTHDGCFIAYKAVRADRKDKYSGTFDNSDGAVVQMKSNEVCHDRKAACAKGLHVGTKEYATDFASDNDVLLRVKVNPAHVVSVPEDANHAKCRVSEYKVLCEEARAEPLTKSYYDSSEYETVDDCDDDDCDDYDDYDDDDCEY